MIWSKNQSHAIVPLSAVRASSVNKVNARKVLNKTQITA